MNTETKTFNEQDMTLGLTQLMTHTLLYFATEDASQIAHTQCVANYTHLIAQGEGYTPRQVILQQAAAWLHDIGCPLARSTYGDSQPEHQHAAGRIVAAQHLQSLNWLTQEEKDWIVEVVAHHHMTHKATELNFQPLLEADLIVNLFEGYYNMDKAPVFYERVMKTATGKKLFEAFFMNQTK